MMRNRQDRRVEFIVPREFILRAEKVTRDRGFKNMHHMAREAFRIYVIMQENKHAKEKAE